MPRSIERRLDMTDATLAFTEAGEGPAVLLLHGWMCNRGFWRRQIPALAQTHRVVAVDFRGHGESSGDRSAPLLEQLVDDIRGTIDKLGLAPLVLVGHSMGGMVAQQLAARHGGRLSGLVLATTIAADQKDRLLSKQIEKNARDGGFRAAFDAVFGGWLGPRAGPGLAAWIKSEMLRTSESVALSLVRSYRDFDVRAELPNVSVPTLVVSAAADRSAVPSESLELSRLIPGAELKLLDSTGHFPMLEAPESFNRTVVEFLARRAL